MASVYPTIPVPGITKAMRATPCRGNAHDSNATGYSPMKTIDHHAKVPPSRLSERLPTTKSTPMVRNFISTGQPSTRASKYITEAEGCLDIEFSLRAIWPTCIAEKCVQLNRMEAYLNEGSSKHLQHMFSGAANFRRALQVAADYVSVSRYSETRFNVTSFQLLTCTPQKYNKPTVEDIYPAPKAVSSTERKCDESPKKSAKVPSSSSHFTPKEERCIMYPYDEKKAIERQRSRRAPDDRRLLDAKEVLKFLRKASKNENAKKESTKGRRPYSAIKSRNQSLDRRADGAVKRRTKEKYRSEKPIYGRQTSRILVGNAWSYEVSEREDRPRTAGLWQLDRNKNHDDEKPTQRPRTANAVIQLASSDIEFMSLPYQSSDEQISNRNLALKSSGLGDYSRMVQSSQINPTSGSNCRLTSEEDVQDQELLSVLASQEKEQNDNAVYSEQHSGRIGTVNRIPGMPWDVSRSSASILSEGNAAGAEHFDVYSQEIEGAESLSRHAERASNSRRTQSAGASQETEKSGECQENASKEKILSGRESLTLIDLSVPERCRCGTKPSRNSRPFSAFQRRPQNYSEATRDDRRQVRTRNGENRFFPYDDPLLSIPMQAGSNMRLMSPSRRLQLQDLKSHHKK